MELLWTLLAGASVAVDVLPRSFHSVLIVGRKEQFAIEVPLPAVSRVRLPYRRKHRQLCSESLLNTGSIGWGQTIFIAENPMQERAGVAGATSGS